MNQFTTDIVQALVQKQDIITEIFRAYLETAVNKYARKIVFVCFVWLSFVSFAQHKNPLPFVVNEKRFKFNRRFHNSI